jgi:hypothetical protein
MDKKNSNISGFIDGYKAGNLSLLSTLFNQKRNEISIHLNNVIDSLSVNDDTEAKMFITEVRKLKTNINYSKDSFDAWIYLGETLENIIKSYKTLDSSSQTLVLPDLRKIIYHFIDFAKKSEDQKLIDLAIEIGESLN